MRKRNFKNLAILGLIIVICGCVNTHPKSNELPSDFRGERIICMSSTYAACLSQIGRSDAVVGISGVRYISDSLLRGAAEVGPDTAPDFETIISLKPDLVLGWGTEDAEPAYMKRLRKAGIRTMVVNDYLESDPVERLDILRMLGRIAGAESAADSLYDVIVRRYSSLRDSVAMLCRDTVGVLMNLPYSGNWYIPGSDNYFTKMLSDAGARVLGSRPGRNSSVITLEDAFALSASADVWLNPGNCSSREQIGATHDLIRRFPSLSLPIYNNILRANSEGGNDFWESGSVRIDHVLEDLCVILHPDVFCARPLHYYIEVH